MRPWRFLFEVATTGPGRTVDEALDGPGSPLPLPLQFEEDRATLEQQLTGIAVRRE